VLRDHDLALALSGVECHRREEKRQRDDEKPADGTHV
jgi:hypothetical protein